MAGAPCRGSRSRAVRCAPAVAPPAAHPRPGPGTTPGFARSSPSGSRWNGSSWRAIDLRTLAHDPQPLGKGACADALVVQRLVSERVAAQFHQKARLFRVQTERADRSRRGRRKADPLIHPQRGQGQPMPQEFAQIAFQFLALHAAEFVEIFLAQPKFAAEVELFADLDRAIDAHERLAFQKVRPGPLALHALDAMGVDVGRERMALLVEKAQV